MLHARRDFVNESVKSVAKNSETIGGRVNPTTAIIARLKQLETMTEPQLFQVTKSRESKPIRMAAQRRLDTLTR